MREPNYKCDQCGKEGYKKPSLLKNRKNIFCCKECSDKFKDKRVEVICLVCQKVFLKEQCEIKRYGRHCCSKECGKLLRIFHKNWGSSRSKLEIYIENQMKNIFSFFIDYNNTETGYELDIYVPHLDLAIEINGIFHYKAIYGMKKLLRVQQIDKEKVVECKKRNIKLIVIDVSNDKSTKKVFRERFEQVLSLINERIEELNYKPELLEISE
jgi:hypothetical protein